MSDFVDGLARANAEFIDACKRGMGKGMLAWLRDSAMRIPKVPHDTGTLQGSGSVFVDKDLIAVAEDVGGDPTPSLEVDKPPLPGQTRGAIGYNTDYAMKTHEGVELNFVEQGTGAKFLETAMAEGAGRYWGVIVQEVRGVL